MLERHTLFTIPSPDPIDLPVSVHRCSLNQSLAKVGSKYLRRSAIGAELAEIFNAALSTGYLDHSIVFGSFVIAKNEPNDLDDEFEIPQMKRMAASFDFHLIPDEVRTNEIGCTHLALLN